VRALVAGLLAGGLALSGAVATPSSAVPRPSITDDPDDVFTATIERIERDPSPSGRPARYTYTVQVQEVYGDSDVSSVRVRVQTSAAYGECATRPDSRGSVLYVWQLIRQGTALVADGCRDVLRSTDLRTAELRATYGEPRAPTEAAPAEPPVEFPEVTYSCPEGGEEVADVTGAEGTCEEVAEPRPFDRAAAPGLALVIVGVLGWIVVLRLGRSRRS
jgi:hypothetical protein